MRRQFNCKVFLLVILGFFSVQTTHSKINFSGVDLGENDILLFKAETTAPGIGRFNTEGDIDTAVELITSVVNRLKLNRKKHEFVN